MRRPYDGDNVDDRVDDDVDDDVLNDRLPPDTAPTARYRLTARRPARLTASPVSGYLSPMSKSREKHIDVPTEEAPQGAVADSTGVPESAVPEEEAPGTGAPAGGVPMEPSVEAIRRLEDELDELRDRHVRMAAEFANYRKRVVRENQVLVERAQAALAIKVLDVLDDLDRILDNMDETTPAEPLREAIEMVDKKLRKELESAGLERLDPTGKPFDPTVHEAVAATPSPDRAQDDHVSATFQPGYLFKGTLIRPARVQVYSDQDQG